MDERRLAELFRDAVHDTPPASFNEHDVLVASARARSRRRNSIVAGSALAVALLAGGTFAGVTLWGAENTATTASAPGAGQPGPGKLGTYDAPSVGDQRSADGSVRPRQEDPAESSKQGGAPPGRTGPSANGCGQADRELAAALAGELPAATVTGPPRAAGLACPPGSRGAAVPVEADGKAGVLTVVVAPRGADTPQWASTPPSGVAYPTTAASGSLLVLVSQPAPDSAEAPFRAQLPDFAGKLAAGF